MANALDERTAINLDRYLRAAQGVFTEYLATEDPDRRKKLQASMFKAIGRALSLVSELRP